uniref:Uncharacterized protein n=1 Tax=Arundo donax TaxID=35708 RepID=A0A0A8YE79_ARUDO
MSFSSSILFLKGN